MELEHAKLVGHQNHAQRIQHHMAIKKENHQLNEVRPFSAYQSYFVITDLFLWNQQVFLLYCLSHYNLFTKIACNDALTLGTNTVKQIQAVPGKYSKQE